MLRVSERVGRELISKSTYGFAGLSFGKKRVKVDSDLAKYDVVIAGGHLGGILSSHFDAVVGDKSSVFVAYDNPYYQYHAIRGFYEQGKYVHFLT